MPLLKNTLHWTAMAAAMVLAGGLALAAGLLWYLHPQPGDWQLRLPLLRLADQHLDAPVGIAAAVRLLSQPGVGRLLDGSTWQTPAGPLHIHWDAAQQAQQLRCAPCRLLLPALGSAPLELPELEISLHRQTQGQGHDAMEQLRGQWRAGGIHGRWQGVLDARSLEIELHLQDQPLQQAFALFGSAIPELAHAHIEGSITLDAQARWPAGTFSVDPALSGFAVSGLDTRELLQAPHRCQVDGAPPIATDGLLARAVIAAEDQRFFEHPGYDLIEWQHSLRQNQQARADGRPSRLRGASTLTQQLAKLAFTGDDRTALRKIRELLYAVEMEQSLGKARILQQYLQRVPWGEGQCGGQAAAQHYFGVDAAELNPAQAAWLAAMLHRPDYHARQWRGTGQIDLTRAHWVMDQLRARPRDLTPRQRAQWQRQLEQLGSPRPQGKSG